MSVPEFQPLRRELGEIGAETGRPSQPGLVLEALLAPEERVVDDVVQHAVPVLVDAEHATQQPPRGRRQSPAQWKATDSAYKRTVGRWCGSRETGRYKEHERRGRKVNKRK